MSRDSIPMFHLFPVAAAILISDRSTWPVALVWPHSLRLHPALNTLCCSTAPDRPTEARPGESDVCDVTTEENAKRGRDP